ncbi:MULTISPECIES: hypothetical protein [unclassified Burkholderia]|uniref:hypothetical protein n=1 Tax=unclassified Burkholderia TaxID=2613784 RepID=UPI0021BDD860|nr:MULTISPECIES: hypothetical protein [unclassified Burkholderia]
MLHRHTPDDANAILRRVCETVSAAADIPPDKVWVFWHPLEPALTWRADWNDDPRAGPIVRIFCRRSHAAERVQRIVATVRESLGAALACAVTSIFVQVIRVEDEEVFNVS